MTNFRAAICLLLVSVHCFGQGDLIVYAGEDTNFCGSSEVGDFFVPFKLNAEIDGGVPPYSFSWSLVDPVYFDGQWWDADQFLDSTNLLKPMLITRVILSNDSSYTAEVIELAVNVTDSAGNSSSDTIRISISSFSWHFGIFSQYINEGDSIKLHTPNFFGGINPVVYHWEPSSSVIGEMSQQPLVKPVATTNYNVTLTDAEGCTETEAGAHNMVYVEALSIQDDTESNEEHTVFDVFPNPTRGDLTIDYTGKEVLGDIQYTIHNAHGQIVRKGVFANSRELNQIHLNGFNGIYSVTLSANDEQYQRSILLHK